jgi:hypothetical protein
VAISNRGGKVLSHDPCLFALLPLILLAIMMALGLVIEEVRYHTLLWATKIPLALLLVIAFFRRR